MTNATEARLVKWPFILGDLLLVGAAGAIALIYRVNLLAHWELLVIFFVALALGAYLLVLPWILEFRGRVQLAETADLLAAAAQWQKAEELAAQIGRATSLWQGVQDHSGKTVESAREIAERMAAETAAFTQFMQKLDDGEKARLRLEVEKLKRGEGEWLQVIVRLLDHTFVLHQAAIRSGKPGLIEQLGNFQIACRDIARRVGLVPLLPQVGDPFDAQRHQLREGQVPPAADARVFEVLGPGYTFQSQLLRPALVELRSAEEFAVAGGDPGEPIPPESTEPRLL